MKTSTHTEIKIKLVGVSFACPLTGVNRQDIIRAYANPKAKLIVQLDPNNEHDPDAVMICVRKRIIFRKKTFSLGYLNKTQNKPIAQKLRAGQKVTAVILNTTGGTKQKETRGVNIKLTY